jgi:hypothetical protein
METTTLVTESASCLYDVYDCENGVFGIPSEDGTDEFHSVRIDASITSDFPSIDFFYVYRWIPFDSCDLNFNSELEHDRFLLIAKKRATFTARRISTHTSVRHQRNRVKYIVDVIDRYSAMAWKNENIIAISPR